VGIVAITAEGLYAEAHSAIEPEPPAASFGMSLIRYYPKTTIAVDRVLDILQDMTITPTKTPRRGKREIVITPEKGETIAQLHGVAARYPGKIVKSTSNPQAVVIYMDEPLFNQNFEFYNLGAASRARCKHCKGEMEAITTSVHPEKCLNWPLPKKS